jgi:predicted ferric reductase
VNLPPADDPRWGAVAATAELPATGYPNEPDPPIDGVARPLAVRSASRSAGGRRSRRALVLALWVLLGIGLWVWWRNTPTGSVDGPPAALTEAGRITGILAGYLLLVQVLLMSRVGLLERKVAANDLVSWHRDLGAVLVTLVTAHVVLITLGYARVDGLSVLRELWQLTTYEDMISAFVATGILIGVGLLAVRAVRAALPYEIWHALHLASYAVLLLSYGHLFALGRDLSEPGLGPRFWVGLYVAVLACLLWGRVLAPWRLNARHRLRVAAVIPESADTYSIYVHGRRLHELEAKAGQFFRWRFLDRGLWSQAHPFSLSAAPNKEWLRLTIKAVGGHTERLRDLRPGAHVLVTGPSGVFTAEHRLRHRALLIAGGSGIAPIRAILEDLPPGTIVIYRASSVADLIFRSELDHLAEARGADVMYVIGARDDPGPRSVISPAWLRRSVPDIHRRDVYLCGPEGLVRSAQAALRGLRVPRKQVHVDPFEF